MPFNEQTLLSGLAVLGTPFTKIKTLAALQKAIKFELPRYASNERVAERETVTVLANLHNAIPAQVTRLVDAIEHGEIGDPRLYWGDLWLLLHFSEQQLRELTSRNPPINEVNRFFTYLQKGFDLPPGYTLQFTDRTGKTRAFPVDHITGWREHKPGRQISIADAVQAGTPQRDFQKFEDYFTPISPGTKLTTAISYKQSLVAECIDLEQKYWDAIK